MDAVTTDNAAFARDVLRLQIEGSQGSISEQIGPQLARFGVMRLLNSKGQHVAQLPPHSAGELRAALASYHTWAGITPDVQLNDRLAALANNNPALRNTPLIVLSAGMADEDITPADRQRFTAIHKQLAQTRSSRAEHQIVDGANHYTIVMRQASAGVVVNAIKRLVTREVGGR